MSTIKKLTNSYQLSVINKLINTNNDLTSLFDTEKEFLEFRRSVVTWLMGDDPAIFNITVTSDIIDYNRLQFNDRALLVGNMVRTVSDRQSFVYNPNN